MQDRPPGLVSRRMFQIGLGRVVVEERWKIDEPGCPMICRPLINPMQLAQGPRYVRQVEMTDEEFQKVKPYLFT